MVLKFEVLQFTILHVLMVTFVDNPGIRSASLNKRIEQRLLSFCGPGMIVGWETDWFVPVSHPTIISGPQILRVTSVLFFICDG